MLTQEKKILAIAAKKYAEADTKLLPDQIVFKNFVSRDRSRIFHNNYFIYNLLKDDYIPRSNERFLII